MDSRTFQNKGLEPWAVAGLECFRALPISRHLLLHPKFWPLVPLDPNPPESFHLVGRPVSP